MADYYKSAIMKMLEKLNSKDLAFFYTLMAKTLWGKNNAKT